MTQLEQDVIDSLTQAIVKSMATGLWDDLRLKIVKIASRGRRRRRGKAVDDSLCSARTRILSAQGHGELAPQSEAAAEVAGIIRLLVAEDPGLLHPLASLIPGVQAIAGSSGVSRPVTQRATASGGSIVQQAGGDIKVNG